MTLPGLVLVGINHMTSAVSCREGMAIPPADLPQVLRGLMTLAGLKEAVVLATCSRMEVIGVAQRPHAAARLLEDWFLCRAGADISSGLYAKMGQAAVQHIFRVTAGLDSWIIGESEIQGQVKRAYQLALERGTTGPVLNRLFQSAMSSGKAIRAKTGIQNGIHSIGGAAALLAKRIFQEGQSGKVVVFGAGEAACAVARHLAAKDFKEIWVANRTLERAKAVAEPLGGQAIGFEEGLTMLAQAEVAVFSASCEKPLLQAAALAPLVQGRSRPIFLIDLGLPRNVEASCAKVPGAYLYDLDDLKEIVQGSMSQKADEKQAAEGLAVEAAGACIQEWAKAEARRLAASITEKA